MEENLQKFEQNLATTNVPSPIRIDATFLSSRSRSITASVETPVTVGSRVVDVELSETVLLKSLTFHVSTDSKSPLYIDIVDISQRSRVLTFKQVPTDGLIKFLGLNILSSGFAVRTDKGIIRNLKNTVLKVDAVGFSQAELSEIVDVNDSLSNLKNECNKLIAEIKDQQQNLLTEEVVVKKRLAANEAQISVLETEKENTESEIEDKKEELEVLSKELISTDEKVQHQQGKLKKVTEDISSVHVKLEERNSELTLKIQESAQLNSDLQKLKSEKSLFTEDLAGYAKQCDGDTGYYTLLVAAPIVFLVALFAYLLWSTSTLTEVLQAFPNKSAWELLLIRLPQAGVVLAFLGICGAMIKEAMEELKEIKARRRRISEVSALVGSAVDGITKTVGMSEDEHRELLVTVKMTALTQFLSGKFQIPNEKDMVLINPVKELPKIAKITKQMPEINN